MTEIAGPSFAFLNARLRMRVDALIADGRAPDDPMAGYYIPPDAAARYVRAVDASVIDERLAEAARLLDLDALEMAVLGLAVAPEIDPDYGKVFAFLHDDVTRKLPSARVIATLLEGDGVEVPDVLACFAAERPLRRRGCLDLRDPEGLRPLVDQPIRVAPELVSFLLGVGLAEPVAGDPLRRCEPAATPLGRADALERIRAVVAQSTPMTILVAGQDAPLLLAAALERPLLLFDARAATDRAVARRAALVCALEGRVAAFDRVEALDAPARARFAHSVADGRARTFVCSPSLDLAHLFAEGGAHCIEVPLPTLAERREAWHAVVPGAAVEEVAAKFRLGVGQIERAAAVARVEAGARGRPQPAPADLDEGARQASTSGLGELAAQLDPRHGWEDLVLPDRQVKLLRSISAYLRQRDRVLGDWGYERTVARTQGLKVLFAGESGTGKTMAAQVLARDLGLQIFVVDLATVVSKYIGETEKNLERIFGAAEGSNAILFFDEADALFGKRSEVSDSHDRHANIEVAYLLQRMERYPGAVVLATNFRHNLDDAFVRRLDFVIDFPFPEVEDRRRIWRLVVPAEAPLEADVDLDFLAERFKLPGGSIRNCSIAAAFEAADAGRPIGMEHLIRAVAVEYGKHGRLTLESDFERWSYLLDDGKAPPPPPAEAEPAPPAEPAPEPLVRSSRVVRARLEEM